MLPVSSALLQYCFYTTCTILLTSCHPADSRKTLVLFSANLMFGRTSVSRWHTETGPSTWILCEHYPWHWAAGEILPLRSGTQAQHLLLRLPWQHHPQQGDVAAVVGDTAPTLVYLWSGVAHRHTGFAPGKLLLCIRGEEQNSQSFPHCHWKEMRARTLFLTLVLGERKESLLHCYCRREKKTEFVMLVLWSWYYPWNEQPAKTQGPVGCFHFWGKLWQSSVSLMGPCLLTKATEMSGFPGHCKTQTIGDRLLPAAWNFLQCQEPSPFSSVAEDFLCYFHTQFLRASCSPLPGTQTPLAHTVPWACPSFWAMKDHCYFSSLTVKRPYPLHKALRRNIIFFSCQRKCEILRILNRCLRGSFTALL